MVRIYISSTYSDLKEYREKVYHKLRELQHDVIAMEDYIAADQRPLDKCLEDVAKSDLYIGLFAWRYGYIPPHDNPEHKSITELEYCKAIETGKSRLIFLLEEQVSWLPKDMDQMTGEGDHGKRISELRRELQQELLLSPFHSPDHLAGLVASAVTLWEKEQASIITFTTINQLYQQLVPIHKVMIDDASEFAGEDIYPEQCNFVSDDLRTANQFIQGLLDAVNHLPMPAVMLAGSLRFQLSRSLYHAEALASELIQLIAAFRLICRSGTRLTATKKKEIQLKLQEFAQSLDDSSRSLGQLTDTIQGKEGIIDSGVQPPQSVSVPTPLPVAPISSVVPMPDPPVLSDSLTRLGEIMFKKYDSDEFKVLCKYMETDYDNLRPGNLKLKMLYLIEHCDRRRGQHEKLIQQMQKDFPDLQGQL